MLTINEVARKHGLTFRALRFYEGKGLITPHRNGLQRLYSEEDDERLRLICIATKMGFVLAEIGAMLQESPYAPKIRLQISPSAIARQRDMLKDRRDEIDRGLALLDEADAEIPF